MMELIDHRVSMVYDFDKCPSCAETLPNTPEELQADLWELTYLGTADESDFWRCPRCWKNFAPVWYPDEACWYDEFEDELLGGPPKEKSEGLNYYICCNRYLHDDCECMMPITFGRAENTLREIRLDAEELYEEDEGLDCSTCSFFCSEDCEPFTSTLASMLTHGTKPNLIGLCQNYQYDPTGEPQYKYRHLTQDMMTEKMLTLELEQASFS